MAITKTQEEVEPPYDDPSQQPQTLTKNRTIHDPPILYVAGKGNVESELMFIATSLNEEEAMQSQESLYNRNIRIPAEYLRGPAGTLFRDVALEAGVNLDNHYYTAMCKWLLPKANRNKPKVAIARWGLPVLQDEIKRVKPKVIVCLGKPAFDMLAPEKINFKDAHGCWTWSEEHNAYLYLMYSPHLLITKPELREMFRLDLKEVTRQLDRLNGVEVQTIPIRETVIRNSEELREWVNNRLKDIPPWLSVDCEWHGTTHVDGNLRSMQLAWTESDVIYIRFMDDALNYTFDVDYKEVGEILKPLCDLDDVKYVGHHYAADAVWMSHVLGLKVLGKCFLDTEFAQQTADEHSELGLERGIAMRYTTLGRYDQALVEWKRANKKLCEKGYGLIPDEILIPYANRDVIAVFRAIKPIIQQLRLQQTWTYYQTIFHPFVTDVFVTFCLEGLPMDIPLMDDLRELFNFAREKLELQLQATIAKEAKDHMYQRAHRYAGPMGMAKMMTALVAFENDESGKEEDTLKQIKRIVGPKNVAEMLPVWEHYLQAPQFNIRSKPQLVRWLFEVCELTPVKSTSQKDKGMPSMAWEKVLKLPPERQKLYVPATDKQTLEILSPENPIINQLIDLNVVGNLVKAFMKEPKIDYNDDGDMIEEEAGLHKWLASNGKVHGMMSTTETGRPRSWKPNTLNWPSFVNERICRAIAQVIEDAIADGTLPDSLRKWMGKKIPSIRSCVLAPAGDVFVESDYQTAEIRGLAFISGDRMLITMMTQPDDDFGLVKVGDDTFPVRLKYRSEKETGIPIAQQDPNLLWHYKDDDGLMKLVVADDLLKHGDGSLIHPSHDLHWSLAERGYAQPRELMNAKVERSSAKVANFSSAYGATGSTMDRKIEADTGNKPAPGTGQLLLDAIADRQPDATHYLNECAEVPEKVGFMRAASGRLRHFTVHRQGSGVGYRTRNSLNSAQGREARNFPMQESVAATAARAGKWLLDEYIRWGLKARPVIILYDSVVTQCPLEERFIVRIMHDLFMFRLNQWQYDDRILSYPIDNEYNYRWSTKPSKAERGELENTDWNPTPTHLQLVERLMKARLTAAVKADEAREECNKLT